MLHNFILCDILCGFDVDKVFSHLIQLCSLHKKLKSRKRKKKNEN